MTGPPVRGSRLLFRIVVDKLDAPGVRMLCEVGALVQARIVADVEVRPLATDEIDQRFAAGVLHRVRAAARGEADEIAGADLMRFFVEGERGVPGEDVDEFVAELVR